MLRLEVSKGHALIGLKTKEICPWRDRGWKGHQSPSVMGKQWALSFPGGRAAFKKGDSLQQGRTG